MNSIYASIDSGKTLRLETKRIKVLKVIGETVGQLVIDNATCINAIKIDRINAKLLKSTDHLFKNKVVKQGIIQKEIFYVDPERRLRFLAEDVPFALTIDIPGFEPNAFTEVQSYLRDIDVQFSLTPAWQCIPGCLRQKIVAHILVITAEWTQIEVITGISTNFKVGSRLKDYYCL